jgi:hypothetical protein
MTAAKSRREITLGLGAAAFVTSIVAPVPGQAASCRTQGVRRLPHSTILHPFVAGLRRVNGELLRKAWRSSA